MHLNSFVTVLGLLASNAAAHGIVSGFYADGKYYGGFLLDYYYLKLNGQPMPSVAGWYAENTDLGFVAPSQYGSSDISCHRNAAPGTTHATVSAGGSIKFLWTTWPDSHKGPVITYLARCPGLCENADKTTLEFFKIDAVGLDTATQTWAADTLIKNNNTWTTKIPSKLAAGNYVLRHEIIALHGAGSNDGAQNYPQCINIAITGSGTDKPAGVRATSLYKATDPGILINIYTTLSSYIIPGPTLYTS